MDYFTCENCGKQAAVDHSSTPMEEFRVNFPNADERDRAELTAVCTPCYELITDSFAIRRIYERANLS